MAQERISPRTKLSRGSMGGKRVKIENEDRKIGRRMKRMKREGKKKGCRGISNEHDEHAGHHG